MKIFFSTLFIIYLSGGILLAQENNTTYALDHSANTYTLNGTINIDTGKISLIPVGKKYYPDDSIFKETIIRHGQFAFTGTAPYPLAVMLLSRDGDGYVSDAFYIEPGTQRITCNKDSIHEIPAIANNSMKELAGNYREAFTHYYREYHELQVEWDSLIAVYNKNSNIPGSNKIKWKEKSNELGKEYYKTLLAYATNHPDSYVALWKLIRSVEFGYSPIYDRIFDQFSTALKDTYTGRELKKKLGVAKNTDIGKEFPKLALLDTAHAAKNLVLTNGAHQYTLIDFWFSHCGPCLGQFPKYKNIYDTYRNKGLEIIGISADKTEALADWKKVIAEKELPWPQYLDENGAIAASLVITSFPRNFLLDEHNVIIRKDITPEQLEEVIAK